MSTSSDTDKSKEFFGALLGRRYIHRRGWFGDLTAYLRLNSDGTVSLVRHDGTEDVEFMDRETFNARVRDGVWVETYDLNYCGCRHCGHRQV